MDKNDKFGLAPVYEKAMKAGRRTYFFDVRETRSGDYYLTITESKKTTNDDGSVRYEKHKIYLYKEDFTNFREHFDEMTGYILEKKGKEVISEKHDPGFKGRWDFDDNDAPSTPSDKDRKNSRGGVDNKISDIEFEDID